MGGHEAHAAHEAGAHGPEQPGGEDVIGLSIGGGEQRR
jgi:hypothetical protein